MKRSSKRGARLGQHFLTSREIARAVADAAYLSKTDTVLEIGPGKGILTRELLATGAKVIAVEKDPALVVFLKEDLPNPRLKVIEGDVREKLPALSFQLPASYKVVANIPYYITGELLRMFLTAKHQPTTIVFLVQKEVAERIARSKKESLLSLSVKAYGTPQYVRAVKAGSFNPPPSVDSAILAIEGISRKNFKNVSEETFFTFLHAGFGQKRKTVLGNLNRMNDLRGHSFEERWRELGLDPHIRAEDVSLETWLALARN